MLHHPSLLLHQRLLLLLLLLLPRHRRQLRRSTQLWRHLSTRAHHVGARLKVIVALMLRVMLRLRGRRHGAAATSRSGHRPRASRRRRFSGSSCCCFFSPQDGFVELLGAFLDGFEPGVRLQRKGGHQKLGAFGQLARVSLLLHEGGEVFVLLGPRLIRGVLQRPHVHLRQDLLRGLEPGVGHVAGRRVPTGCELDKKKKKVIDARRVEVKRQDESVQVRDKKTYIVIVY